MPSRHPLAMRIPLLETYPSGPTRMQVQRQYEAQRSGGASVQQAIRNLEDIFDIYKVTVDSSGKTVVNFKINEDAFTDALSKFTGMQFDACPVCKELLAHRGGKALPCHNPKCPAKGKPVNETWYSSAFDRGEAEKDWVDAHPGFQFGVYAGRTLLSTHPSIPSARREAKKHVGQGKNISIVDVKHPDRRYWHEETDHLKESAYPGATQGQQDLLAALQAELPGIHHIYDAYPLIDFQSLKFEIGVSKRLRFPDVTVKPLKGREFGLPLELAQELLKAKQAGLRSLKKYVQSRW